MVAVLLVLFSLTIILVYLEEYLGKWKWPIYIIIGIALIYIASFKIIGNDDDSSSYELMFLKYDDSIINLTVETSFTLIARILNTFTSDVHSIFFFYAIIAIPLKLYSIHRFSEYLFLPLLVYMSHFFILHDMIEIRASVAAAFFIFSVIFMCEKRKKVAFCILLLSFFFHYSALVLFPLLVLSNKPLSNKWKICLAMIVPIGYVLYYTHFDPLTTISIPYIGEKLEIYQNLKEYGKFDEILVFKNPILLIKIAVFYLLLYFHNTVIQHNKNLPLILKIMGASIGSFFFFSDLPVLSGRLYELYGAIDIISIPLIFYIFKPKWISRTIIIGLSAIMIYMDVFVYSLIR